MLKQAALRELSFRDRFGTQLALGAISIEDDGGPPNAVLFVLESVLGQSVSVVVDDDGISTIRSWASSSQDQPELVLKESHGEELCLMASTSPRSHQSTAFLTIKNAAHDPDMGLAGNPDGSLTEPTSLVLRYLTSLSEVANIAAIAACLLKPTRRPPRIARPYFVAHALMLFKRSNLATGMSKLKRLHDDEIMQTLTILAARGRLDLAVLFLEELLKTGRMKGVLAGPSQYGFIDGEKLWQKIRHLSGADVTPTPPEFIQRWKEKSDQSYQPYDYVDCFDRTFGEPFEKINFENMDFVNEQALLRRLAEYLDQFFAGVVYPASQATEVIPYVVIDSRWTAPGGFRYIQTRYTPPLWHDEARRLLLFAHKVAFEDPLDHFIDPLMGSINARPFSPGGTLRIEPSEVNPADLKLLRQMLLNVQKMAPLIRTGIVIPHSLRTDRIPGYRNMDPSNFRFPDANSYRIAERLADVIGALVVEGHADGFRFPQFVISKAKQLAASAGNWNSIAWLSEFFDEIAIHDDTLAPGDPIRDWPMHLYRLALHKRYIERHHLGYSPHFMHRDGYQLYAMLEAADIVTSADDETLAYDPREYSKNLGGGRVQVSQLDAFLRPRLDILKDKDLVSMRSNEELFEMWRNMVSAVLAKARTYELETGRSQQEAVAKELEERYNEWRSHSAQQVRSGLLKQFFDIGKGATVSTVGALLSGALPGVASLSIGAAYKTLEGMGRALGWRKKQQLYSRHFLSIIDGPE